MEPYVTTTYRLHDSKCNGWFYEFISMYVYNLSVCRFSVFSRRSGNVFCPGNDLYAVFADVLAHLLLMPRQVLRRGRRLRSKIE